MKWKLLWLVLAKSFDQFLSWKIMSYFCFGPTAFLPEQAPSCLILLSVYDCLWFIWKFFWDTN